MKNIFLTTKAIIKDNLNSKETWFFIIFFPIFLTLIFALGFGAGTQVHEFVIINNSQVGKFINGSQLFTALYGNNEKEALLHNYIYVQIIKDNVSIYYPQDDKYLVPSLQALINQYYTNNSQIHYSSVLKYGNSYYEYIISGMIGVVALSNGIFGVTGVASGYYRDRLVDRLAASPLKSYEWVTSLVIYEIIITLISITPILALSLLFGFLPLIGLSFIGFLIISTLMFSGLGAIIFGLTPKDKLFVSNVAANVVTIPLIFLSTAFFSIYAFPSSLRVVVQYQPVSVIDSIIRDIIVYNVPPNPFYIIYVILGTLIFLALGSRLMKLREFE
ncbi:ABC transporter permease [Acidianus brierleyi]|uniref:ABC transporter n=1 Tax=Acidianus brierleyi TaxID=41673 RepID=A0A2U9IIK7_9CREN|nr:ABC transporter permease [Acidianus brierleyi]AWR95869.1 ABC transporter permease [Acidianus brierleyi]